MKKMNIVRNTITEGTETYRERSRIGSINHRIWSVIAPVSYVARISLVALLLLFLGGWNIQICGATPTYNSGTWYSLYKTDGDYKVKNGTILEYSDVYAPTNGQCIFDYKKYSWLSTDSKIEVRCDGTTKNSVTAKSSDWNNNYIMSGLSTNYSKITLTKTSGDGAQARNVRVVLAKHILLDNGTTYGTNALTGVTLNATACGNTSSYHINLRSFYVDNTTIKYESDNSEFHFGNGATTKSVSVKSGSCAAAGGSKNCASTATELGNPDNQEVDLYFTPSSNKNGSSSATITIYDGTTKRATITVSAKVIPTYYFKATAVATAGGAEVKASFTEGSYSAASETTSVTATKADVASLTKTAYFYAPLNKGDYYFQGWYAESDCSGTRLSTDQTLTRTITANSLNSASPSETKYYAQYKQVIRAEFSGAGQSMMVDGTYDGISYIRTSSETASASSSDGFWYEIRNNTPSGNTTGSTHPSQIISYNPSTKVVTAHNAGTATLVLHQKNVGLYEAIDKEYTFTVYKYNSVFANVADLNVKVDGTVSSSYTLTYKKPNDAYIGADNHLSSATPSLNSGDLYYTLVQDVQTSVTTGSDQPTWAIAYDAANKKATGKNAGKGTVHLYQKETYKYNAADKSFNVSVTKHDNTIKVKGSTSYSSSIYVDSYDNELTLTADNTDYTNCPITNTQTAGTDIATFYQNDEVVYSSHKLGTATWTLSQPENYKYLPAQANFTINVVRKMNADSDECYYISDPTSVTVGAWNNPIADGPDIEINGWGTKVSCQAAKSAATAIDEFYIQYKTATMDWTDLVKLNDLQKDKYKDYGPYDLPAGTTHIRFVTHLGATYAKYYRNVNITRATSLSATDSVKITKTSGNQPIYRNYIGEGTATVNWSCSSGENLIAKFDNSKFTFGEGTGYTLNEDKTIATITGSDCGGGTTNLIIHYQSYTIGTDTATLTVYNQAYNVETAVLGTTVLSEQSFRWIDNFDMMSVGQEITEATVHTSMPDNTITYTSDDDMVIRVDDEGTKLVAVGEGTTRITATSLGDVEYATAVIEKYIEVTKLETQYIVWNQSFLNLKLGGDNVTLNATATSDLDCASNNQRAITYSSDNTSIVSIVNTNQLKINGVGTTTITAYQAGGADADNHVFAPTSRSVTVVVKDPNAVCESYIYEQQDGNSFELYKVDLSMPELTQEVSFEGEPRTVSFSVKGVQYKLGAITAYKGHIFLDEWYDGTWHEVYDCGEPTEGADYAPVPEQNLHRNATKIRFRRPQGGQGHHYIANVKVTRARYIEIESPIVFENVKVGQDVPKVVTVYYSNVHDDITLTQGQLESPFSLSTEMEEHNCGDHGSFDLTINYNPQAAIEEEEVTLKLSDGKIETTAILRGSASLTSRSIVWDLDDVVERYTVQTETLTAEAQNDLGAKAGEIFYSIGGSSTEGAGVLTGKELSFTKAGTVYVVAQGVSNDRYNMPVAVTKRFDVAITPTIISTLPVLAAVTSGTAVEDVELTGWQVTNTVNGGVVEGTLAITSADLINVGTNTVTLTFTPDNTDMYVGCTTTTTIVVNKATSVAIPSAANIVYGQKVKESELSNEGTEGTWAWNTENNEAVLDAGTHEGLAVHFTPTSGNYTELDATVTLTVEKADPEVTAQASAITYGQAISASELSTATGNISGTWAWAVDEEQVLSVGDHVLKANFTSTNANYSDLSNVDVTLTVNKIEKLEVPVALSFCAGGEVTFHGNTYTEAGEYQIEAEGATRDTVYNVTVTMLQPTTGTDSKTITVGASESWNGKDLSGYAVGSHEVVFHTENVAGCDSTITLSLTVVPATNTFTNTKGDGNWDDPENWESGIPSGNDPDVIIKGALEINDSITVHNLTIESTGSVAVISGGTLTVNGTSEDRTEYGDVHVMSDGALALGISANLQVRDFTLDASLGNSSHAATSGQVNGDVNLHINRDAYFQMSFDPSGEIDYGWYDFTVPFEVEVLNGVYDEHMNKLTNGVDYIAMNFNEARRASIGKGWGSFTGTMQPGRIYSIGFDETKTWNTFIFKKKSGSYLLSNGSFTTECSNVGAAEDRGWNGLGNGTLQHRELTSLNGEKVQVYNHSEDRYEAYDADEKAYAVGTAFFVQADANMGTIDLTTTDGTKALRAPQYASRALDEFRLTLTAEGEDRYTDRMWVSASDEATGEYVIGHDLLKMGTPKDAKVAQMWTVNNDLRLCDIEMPLINDMSQCPLMFFAPNALTYEIAVDQAPEDATLYLTYNDRIIWSLSASPYTIDLAKGTTEGYGLRIVARHNAPSVATGMDELNVDENGNRKVFIDNMLYIITPEGAMYSVTGEKVK